MVIPLKLTGTYLGHVASWSRWTFGILLYEMLYGFTPFRGNSRDETFRNVLEMDLKFPDTPHVRDI